MRYLSTFTGIGGFEIGIQRVLPLAQCIGYSEVDKPAIKTYEEHYEHHNYGDITAIDAATLPDFDLIVGGFPCQAFSVAGKRRGFDEARGTLFFDVARILKHKRPGHLVLENVKGLLNHDGGKTFTVILGILADLGYRVEWQILNSKNYGVPQNRERIYIVGHLGDGCSRQIFPLGEGGGGDIPAQGAEQGQGERLRIGGTRSIAATLATRDYKGGNNLIKQINPGMYQDGRVYDTDGISPTINPAAQAGGAVIPKIITGVADRGRPNGTQWEARKDGIANTVRTGGGRGSTPHMTDGVRIRRLTPIECERLQGFPDNWTVGSDTQRYKQCGNAVTTNVVEAVMSALHNANCI